MTSKDLKELGFKLDTESKRAIYDLDEHNVVKIIVESDKTIWLNFHGMRATVNAEDDPLSAIADLIKLFEGTSLKYPF